MAPLMPTAWKAGRLERVTASSLAAEAYSMMAGVAMAELVLQLWCELTDALWSSSSQRERDFAIGETGSTDVTTRVTVSERHNYDYTQRRCGGHRRESIVQRHLRLFYIGCREALSIACTCDRQRRLEAGKLAEIKGWGEAPPPDGPCHIQCCIYGGTYHGHIACKSTSPSLEGKCQKHV
eukprot:4172131-Amphidinium_carterae.2